MTLTTTTLDQPTGAAAQSRTPQDEAARRKYCSWLAYWRDCETPPCRRAHACAGDPTACFVRHWAGYPEAARVWVRAGLFALDEGLSARAAALSADAALVRHVKTTARLPLHDRKRRRRPA